MCVKLPPRNLNPSPYFSHLASTYTYAVTITPRKKLKLIPMGMINRKAHINVYVGPRAQPKEELLLGQAKPKRKRTVSHLKVTHQTTPQKRISIKKENDKERHGNI